MARLLVISIGLVHLSGVCCAFDWTQFCSATSSGSADESHLHADEKARLLFRSGFEPDVVVAAPFAHNGHWWQEFAGRDKRSGYAWPADVPAAARVWFYYSVLKDKTLADFVETRIEQVRGPHGAPTHALYMAAKRDDPDTSSNTRSSLELRMGRNNDELEQAFCRYWIKLQPNLRDSLHNAPSSPHWRMLMEWFESGSDYRVGLYIHQPRDGGRLYWQLQGQRRSPEVITEWQEMNKDVTVPAGEWFLLEVYFNRSTDSDGRYQVSVNRKLILDHRGKNMKDSPLGTWCLFKAYTPKAAFDHGPVFQWIDDVEIWSTMQR